MRNRFISALIMSSIVIILLAFFLKTLGIFDENIKTYPAQIKKLKIELEKDAYIFRDEVIIGAAGDGEIEYYVEEGERVYAGQPIASQTIESLEDEYDDEGRKKTYILDSLDDYMIDLEKIRSNIRSLEDELAYLVQQDKYSEIEDVKQRLGSLYIIQSAFKDSGSLTQNLPLVKATREEGRYIYYAPIPGLVGLEQSNYDQLFHINNIHLINYQKLQGIEGSSFLRQAHKNQGFIRLVDNKETYIVTELTENELALFDEGGLCTIYIGDKRISVENYQLMRTEQQTGMVFRCFEDYPGMTSSRFERVTIIPEETEGIYVKTKSIIELEGQPGVYILKNNGKKVFVPIKIKGHIADEAVIYSDYFTIYRDDEINESIETVNLYDEIVEEP